MRYRPAPSHLPPAYSPPTTAATAAPAPHLHRTFGGKYTRVLASPRPPVSRTVFLRSFRSRAPFVVFAVGIHKRKKKSLNKYDDDHTAGRYWRYYSASRKKFQKFLFSKQKKFHFFGLPARALADSQRVFVSTFFFPTPTVSYWPII